MSWFGPGYPIRETEMSEPEPKAAESDEEAFHREYIKLDENGDEKPASSSEFDEGWLFIKSEILGLDAASEERHIAAGFSLRDIKRVYTQAAKENAELTEENQRLKAECGNYQEYIRENKAEERIEKLEKENAELKAKL